jgi:sulfite exporter TauE/SafE
MIELPLVFLGGLLGSAHCIGMCGPFALTIGSGAMNLRVNLTRQFVYTLGRIFTYSTLGALAGFGGWRMAQSMPAIVNLPAVLAVVAGGLLLYQGLLAAGVLRKSIKSGIRGPCLGGTMLATFLIAPGLSNVFLAGVFTGFLPCGLVYAFLALAGSSGSLPVAAVTMAVFGAGTAPIMLLTGCGGSLLSLARRRWLYQLAAWCVVLTGAVSLARGFGFLHIPGWFDAPGCPLCR